MFLCAEELDNHLHQQLIMNGYVPTEEEIETITDIFMSYLLSKGAILEIEEGEFD